MKVSTSRKALILFSLFIVMLLVFGLVLSPAVSAAIGGPAPDMRTDLDYFGYRAAIGAMKAGPGLGAYRAFEALDAVFPLVYALAFAASIGIGLKTLDLRHGPAKWLLLVPVLTALADYAENALIGAMISLHPGDYAALASLAAVATWVKFALFMLTVICSLVLGALAVADRYRPRIVNTVRAPSPIGPYSQAVKVGRFIFLSGQLGIDPESGKLAEGAAAQAERALDNIEAVLEAEGSTMDDLVKTTIFLADLADFQAVHEVYASRFAAATPARSTVQVAALPRGGLVEIEGIARFR